MRVDATEAFIYKISLLMHGSSQFSDRNVKDSGLFCEYYSDIIQHPSGTEFSFFIQT